PPPRALQRLESTAHPRLHARPRAVDVHLLLLRLPAVREPLRGNRRRAPRPGDDDAGDGRGAGDRGGGGYASDSRIFTFVLSRAAAKDLAPTRLCTWAPDADASRQPRLSRISSIAARRQVYIGVSRTV